jgi:3-oxoacyl-[acyl-carrier protein] reductase
MTNSVAVIAGASQGIGRATAVRLARDFSALVLVARNRANLESTAGLARDTGTEVLVTDADLGEASAAQAVVDKTLSKFGRIDALLNIAGAVPQIDLFEMNDAQWDAGLALKYPKLTADDIHAALRYAADPLAHEEVVLSALGT